MGEEYVASPMGHEISALLHGIWPKSPGKKDPGNSWILRSAKHLYRFAAAICKRTAEKGGDGFNIIGSPIYMDTSDGGLLAVVSLSESHLAVYVSPDRENIHYNLYTCRRPEDGRKTLDHFRRILNPICVKKEESAVPVSADLATKLYGMNGKKIIPSGREYSTVLFKPKASVSNDNERMMRIIRKAIRVPNLIESWHPFEPQGLTVTGAWPGGYFAGHTFPEKPFEAIYLRMFNIPFIPAGKSLERIIEATKARHSVNLPTISQPRELVGSRS